MESFICAGCGGEFEQVEGREEVAQKEAKARYGKDASDPSMAKVCADCYARIRLIEERVVMARSARWN